MVFGTVRTGFLCGIICRRVFQNRFIIHWDIVKNVFIKRITLTPEYIIFNVIYLNQRSNTINQCVKRFGERMRIDRYIPFWYRAASLRHVNKYLISLMIIKRILTSDLKCSGSFTYHQIPWSLVPLEPDFCAESFAVQFFKIGSLFIEI